MRAFLLLVVSFLTAGNAGSALAQVTVDLNALKPLQHAAPHSRPATRPARQHRVPQPLPLPPEPPVVAQAPAAPAAQTPMVVQTPAPATQTPAVAQTPAPVAPAPAPVARANPALVPATRAPKAAPPPAPAVAAITPAVPAAPPAPPPPQIGAPPTATPGPAHPSEASITFTPGESALTEDAARKLAEIGHAAAQNTTATVNVLAYAPADPHDPSAARRMSLQRALSVRTALMSAGMPSSRIYLRALGSEPGAGSPDRAEITMLGANLPATAQADTKGKQQ